MAFCKEFEALDKYDQDLYIAMLVHTVRVNSKNFEHGKNLIELAKVSGDYAKIKFGIEALKDNANIDEKP